MAATAGAPSGATAVNHELAFPLLVRASSAVPVLAPAGTGRSLRSVAIPSVTAARMPARTGPNAEANDSGTGAGWVSGVTVVPLTTDSPSCGVARTPVATADVHSAFCSGVTVR